jgi:hydroxymethylpyrimidine pyrophosphatase-like HAD family hydrolase
MMKVGAMLRSSPQLADNQFEPKSYMVTVNHVPPHQTTHQLGAIIEDVLRDPAIPRKKLRVDITASSVDVSLECISKYSGLILMLQKYMGFADEIIPEKLKDIAAIGDQEPDWSVLEHVGRPYCPKETDSQLGRLIAEKNPGKWLNKPHIEAVVEMIENECGIKIV